MVKLITALAPVFAAGLGIQQLGELLSPIVDKITTDYKKIILGLLSLALGLLLASRFELHVINLLLDPDVAAKHPWLDTFVTGIIISGGTEGINSILKFLKYQKEDVKTDAALKDSASKTATAAAAVPVPTEAALAAINKK